MKKFKLTTEKKYKITSGLTTTLLSAGTLIELGDFVSHGNMLGVVINSAIFTGLVMTGSYLCFSKDKEFFEDLDKISRKDNKK